MHVQIGLAVGDIEKVRINARLKRLAFQVDQFMDIELGFPKSIIKRRDKRVFTIKNCRCGMFLKAHSYTRSCSRCMLYCRSAGRILESLVVLK